MSLIVDAERLRRGRAGDTLAFVLWANFDPEPDAADLRHVAAQVSVEYGGERAPYAEQWIKSVRGWSGVLAGVERFQDGIRWLELFADAYGGTIDGIAAGQTRLSGGALGSVPRGPVTAVAYATGDLTSVPRDERGPIWFVDHDVTTAVVAAAQDWVVTPGCRSYITRDGGYWGMEMEGLDWQQAVVEGIERYVNVIVRCRRSRPTRMRKVELWPHGTVSYSDHDPSLSLPEKLALARQPLTFAVQHTDLAFVTTEGPSGTPWHPDSRDDSWPHVHESDVRYNRPLLASMVPDANGIQILTAAHLERANDLSDWTVTPLGHGRYLVEATDLDLWYGHHVPDPAVREKAREDFGDMIMTPQLIEENSPWAD